jgi:hopene-associated glycosyltransferase HpnB
MLPTLHPVLTVLGTAAAAAWIYLVGFRGAFWMTSRYHDLADPNDVQEWPRVVAIVPARDEAAGVGDCVRSILNQQYAGDLSMILIDDQSSDGTARVAVEAASSIGAASRLTVLTSEALPEGWTGKLWAVSQGVARAQQQGAPFLLLTDADIVYEPDVVARLVAHAQSKHLVMTSVMAQLRRVSFAERLLIPAFIYFFQMLYPFSWARRSDSSTAAAAGGCILVRREALQQAGGIESIRGALIDDCALAAR